MLGFGFLGFAGVANAHSWIHCTDYRGDVANYEQAQCFGHPRPKNNNYPDAQAFGVDRGHDTQNAVCQSTETNTNAQFPTAAYKRGQTVTLAWPSKNHVAATCTNPFIPDTSTKLFVTTGTPGANPNPASFTQVAASFSDDPHVNGVIDFKGFQNCPDFCSNTDKSLCTGTFVVPDTMADGTYTFQWSWVFNNGAPPYVSCFEATVAGAETAPAPVTAPTNPPNAGPAPTPRPTTADKATCGAEGDQCDGALFSGTGCCQNGLQCFRQSDWFSQCLSTCPGDWECSETASCVAKGEQCGGMYYNGPTCCSSGTCYKNSGYFSECRDDCPSGWECGNGINSWEDDTQNLDFGMGGGISLGAGALVAFLLLIVGAIGVFYGRCWERKVQAKVAAEGDDDLRVKTTSSFDGESLTKVQMSDRKNARRSTLTMPKVDKKGKPKSKPPARPPAPPAPRPPTFRAGDYAEEV